MKKGAAELVFILDKSGSMAGLEADTIGGFNSMLEKQRALSGECRITTALFSTRCELLHDRVELAAVSPITRREYSVGGGTALLDAIGQTVHKLIAVQRGTAEEYRAERVLFVIITDGEENSSREYSYERVRELIERQKSEYGWEFVFLGANIDAAATAGRFGVAADRAVDYVADAAGTALNFRVMSEAVAQFRASPNGCISSEHFEAIRVDRRKRGAGK